MRVILLVVIFVLAAWIIQSEEILTFSRNGLKLVMNDSAIVSLGSTVKFLVDAESSAASWKLNILYKY